MEFTHAESSTLKMSACDCGNINVTYKSVTLHFTREEFYQFGRAISQFLDQLTITQPLFMADPSGPSRHSLNTNKDLFD